MRPQSVRGDTQPGPNSHIGHTPTQAPCGSHGLTPGWLGAREAQGALASHSANSQGLSPHTHTAHWGPGSWAGKEEGRV